MFILRTAHIPHHFGKAPLPLERGKRVSSPPPATDAECGPQPHLRLPSLSPGDSLTLAQLLHTRRGAHPNRVMTGYAGRMGPPQREEMGPITRELEAARILARSPAAANLLNVRMQVRSDILNPSPSASSSTAPLAPRR